MIASFTPFDAAAAGPARWIERRPMAGDRPIQGTAAALALRMIAVPLLPFLEGLCRDVFGASGRRVTGPMPRDDQRLRVLPDAVVPAAPVVAEAVANAIGHGFAGSRPGRTAVSPGIDGGGEGQGQGGRFTMETCDGTRAVLSLPSRVPAPAD